MKIFMTGGTGFVGSNLAGRLVEEGHSVTVLTEAPPSSEAGKTGLAYIAGHPPARRCSHGTPSAAISLMLIYGFFIFLPLAEEGLQHIFTAGVHRGMMGNMPSK